MLRTFFGLFLIAHAVAHAGLAAAPIPDNPDSKPGAFFYRGLPELVVSETRT
jgi:hypothetical protein